MTELPDYSLSDHNTGDKIGDALDSAADVTDALGDGGLKTGKAGFWLRLSASLARIGANLFGRRK